MSKMATIVGVNSQPPLPQPIRWSKQDLLDAIEKNNVTTVHTIVADCDERGIPHLNLGGDYGNATSAFMLALWNPPPNEEILGILLDARDRAGYPLFDLNCRGPHDQTVLSFILHFRDERLRRSLLQRVLDVRGPDGEQIVDVRADQSNIPLLKQTLSKNDIHCLRMLLDVRLANGQKALNVNEVRHGTTLLDDALETDNCWYHYNQEIVNTIREAGGLCYRDLPRERPVERQLNRRVPQGVVPLSLDNSVENFNRHPQNTHDPSVARTAKQSLLALSKLYTINNDSPVVEETVNQVERFVSSFDYNKLTVNAQLSYKQKRNLARECFNLVKKRLKTVHSYTQLEIRTILYLVWQAVTDNRVEVFPADIRHILDPKLQHVPPHLVDTKKSSFIEKLIEARQEYNGEIDICEGGLIHKLLEALNKAHISVTICTGSFAVLPAANGVPSEVAERHLKTLPIKEQKEILKTWESNESNTQAEQFRIGLKDHIEKELKNRFDNLLTPKETNDILSAIEYLAKPVVHTPLNALLQIIDKIPSATNLRNEAHQVYMPNGLSFQEEFETLHDRFMGYLEKLSPHEIILEEWTRQIKFVEDPRKIAHFPNHLVKHLSAQQCVHLPKDKLQHITDQSVIHTVPKNDFIYLNREQLKNHPELGRYIVMMSTIGVITTFVSLLSYAVLPLLSIIHPSTTIHHTLNLNLQRFAHFCLHILPVAANRTIGERL